VKILRIYHVLLCFIILVMFACDSDPWIHRGNPVDTDNVVITKVTAYGVQEDGVSPYKGQVGASIMSHSVHEKQGLACIDCHHKKGNDDRIKQCAKCHNGQAGYEVMHSLCVDCHIDRKKGPEKCMECH